MTDKVYLIGNRNEYNDYLNNKNNIDYLPMKNLPIVYFPFHYNNNENSIDNIKRYAPIIDNSLTLSTDSDEVKCGESSDVKCTSTDKLFNTLSNIEEEWQPYNNNNLKLILTIIIILWIIILFMILKTIYYILGESTRYTYFIIILLIILLIISSTYALIITGRDF
tara:strand:- start:2129 stop:2626 length:498 start_codon:yes stop_codon:yes gene_type:complete